MQFKYLAEQFANTARGTQAEAHYAALLVRFVLGETDLRGKSSEELQWLASALTNPHNNHATSGCDRCECGCKYWENDRCIDCRTAWDIKNTATSQKSIDTRLPQC